MNEIQLGNIMIDCDDSQGLCEFYHQLLKWEKSTMFGRPAVKSKNGIVFLFAGEKGYVPPVWPEQNGMQQKQMHFDFQVDNVKSMVEYALSLGGRVADEQFDSAQEEFVTMFDPAGHPFCLCAASNPT